MPKHKTVEIRGFKWPHRPTGVTNACLFQRDTFGIWLGIPHGNPWHYADGSRSGIFNSAFVKLIPKDTFWSACFYSGDPQIDVDITLPARWRRGVLEEVDLELDILLTASGEVHVRDQDEFRRVRSLWPMPDHIAAGAEMACEQIQILITHGAEPFGTVGKAQLAHFLSEIEPTLHDNPAHRA